MKTLSLYEDKAGGLHMLRHSDNLVISGLEAEFANRTSQEGQLLYEDNAEYFENESPESLTTDWGEGSVHTEPEGEDAEYFDRHGATPNGIILIAVREGGKWEMTGAPVGSNGATACGQED